MATATTMTTNRIAICMNCSIDDEAYMLNNTNQHKKQRPRLSLRQYGGALTSITETPQLKHSAIFDPTSHRLSSSLTLPSSIQQQHQHNDNNATSSSSRRRHTVQSINSNNDASSTIQWYDSDGSTLLVDFPHNQQSSNNDGDQSVEDGYANQPCSNTHELSDDTTTINIDTNINNDNNTYDKYGRCINHPHIQLRRRQLFSFSSEWKTILKVCPDCCMEELNRLYASSSMKLNDKKKESDLDETELYDDDSTDAEDEDEEDVLGTNDETDD